ncbi:MAG: hypothetical protein AB1511_14355 [Deinococcota bacterium]
MQRMLLGATGLSAVLISCGGTNPPGKTYLGDKPELRTNYIDIATDKYVACDQSLGSIPQKQNILIVEFAAPEATAAQIKLVGEKTGNTSDFLISDLRKSSRGNFIADIVVTNRLVPASLGAARLQPQLATQPQYQYVSLTSRPRGSLHAAVTLDTPNGPETATTGSVNVYESCAFLNNAESRD